jgi:hypothetical protein
MPVVNMHGIGPATVYASQNDNSDGDNDNQGEDNQDNGDQP